MEIKTRRIPMRKDLRCVEVDVREGGTDRSGFGFEFSPMLTCMQRHGRVFELHTPRNVPAPHMVSVDHWYVVRWLRPLRDRLGQRRSGDRTV